MHQKLTETRVASVKASAAKRLEIADLACPGLWLRVTPDQIKTYAIRYRIGGAAARYTIGRHPSVSLKRAREIARELLDDVRKGLDPRHKKYDARTVEKWLTVDHVAEEYLESLPHRARGKRLKASHIKEVARRFRVNVIPEIGTRSIYSITSDTIVRLLAGIEVRATRVAGHTFYDLRGFFKWVVQQGYLPTSPMDGLETPIKPEPRDRVLTKSELNRIWKVCCRSSNAYNTIILLLLLTGQRRGEVTGARWSEFDFNSRTWTIPKHRTKNSREHRIPVSKVAIQILKQCKHAVSTAGTTFPGLATGR